jgi:hypothetical protein
VLIAAEPDLMLFLVCLLYIASGPVMALYARMRGMKKVEDASEHNVS